MGTPKDADGGAAVFHSCPVPGAVQPVGQAADDERPAAGQRLADIGCRLQAVVRGLAAAHDAHSPRAR